MAADLAGHTALITGASRGIGRAVALAAAERGARVVACARGADRLAALVEEIEGRGGQGLAVPCDVCEHQAAIEVQTSIREAGWQVDVLINNAGVARPRKFLETSDAEWSEGLELNLLSAVRFTRTFAPEMAERGWGRIVNVSSTTAKIADPYQAIYGAAKAALVNFSKTTAAVFAADGVTCNCVLPGITQTELVEENIAGAMKATGASAEEIVERTMKRTPIPVGRFGRPEEIADAILFLAGNASEWITGVSLPVDGGTIPVAG